MNKSTKIKIFFLILACNMQAFCQMNEGCLYGDENCEYTSENSYPSNELYNDETMSYDPMQGYSVSTPVYDYPNPYQKCKRKRDPNSFDSDAYLHRRYNNSDNFSSGISSYQGTSTGPGPNGGYPATPRGTYKTNYIPR